MTELVLAARVGYISTGEGQQLALTQPDRLADELHIIERLLQPHLWQSKSLFGAGGHDTLDRRLLVTSGPNLFSKCRALKQLLQLGELLLILSHAALSFSVKRNCTWEMRAPFYSVADSITRPVGNQTHSVHRRSLGSHSTCPQRALDLASAVATHLTTGGLAARLAWRLIGFVTNLREECGLVMSGAAFHINFVAGIDALK
jgi:hypothetical protein